MPRGRRTRNAAAARRQRNTPPRRQRTTVPPPPPPEGPAYMAQPNLDQGMPLECLTMILRYLPIHNRLGCLRVSQRWQSTILLSLERVSVAQLHGFLEFCRKCPELNVKTMLATIDLCTKYMPAVVFKTSLGRAVDAKVLKVLAKKNKIYKSLTLDVNHIENANHLKPLFSKVGLRELHVTVDEWDLFMLSIKAIESVSPRLGHLTLTIRGHIVANNVARYEMGVMFEKLARTIPRLTIRSQNIFALPTLFRFLGGFTGLKELELDSLGEIHEHVNHARKQIEEALQNLRRLKRLHLSGLKSDFPVECLYKLRSLESVRIRGCSQSLGSVQDRARFRAKMLRCNKRLKAENVSLSTGQIADEAGPAAE